MGWIGIISNLFAIGLLTLFVIHGTDYAVSTVHELSEYYVNATTRGNDSRLEKEDTADIFAGLGVSLTILLLVVVYAALALRLWASINLLYGTMKEIQNEEETRISSDTVLKSVANSGESPEGVQVPANQHPQADQQPYTFKELLKYFEANQ
ncbi:unnamed protein product [Diamesa tonsa]